MFPTVRVYDTTSVQIAELERRDAIRPSKVFQLGQDWLLIECEEDHWRLCLRWREIVGRVFYSAVLWEFSHGHKGSDEENALVWAREEISRVEGVWFDLKRQQRPAAMAAPVAAK